MLWVRTSCYKNTLTNFRDYYLQGLHTWEPLLWKAIEVHASMTQNFVYRKWRNFSGCPLQTDRDVLTSFKACFRPCLKKIKSVHNAKNKLVSWYIEVTWHSSDMSVAQIQSEENWNILLLETVRFFTGCTLSHILKLPECFWNLSHQNTQQYTAMFHGRCIATKYSTFPEEIMLSVPME